MTCAALTINFSRNLMKCYERVFQELSNAFFRFFIAIIVTELARKNRKTALFCQNGQHFRNSTLLNMKGLAHGPKILARKSYNMGLDSSQNSSR